MSIIKRLKNNTGSTRIIINRSVDDQDYYYISTNLWVEILEDDDLLDDISTGDLVVNDGDTDLNTVDGIAWLNKFETDESSSLDPSLISNNRIKVDVTGTLTDGTLKVSDNDNQTGFLEDKLIPENNKITINTLNDGGDEDLQIGIVPANIGTSEFNNDANFITSNEAPVQPSDISNFETTAELDARDVNNRNRSNHTGTQLASTISDFTAAVKIAETTTALSFNAGTNILSFTNEDGTTNNIDLSLYLDDTNLSRISSGVLNSGTGICTFTRDDSSTFTVDFSSLNDQAAISTHEASITNHDDVNTAGANIGDVLTFDGTNWISSSPVSNTFKDHARRTDAAGTQFTSPQQYLRLTTTIPEIGNYRIAWSMRWSLNTTSADFRSRVHLDDTTLIDELRREPQDSGGSGVTINGITSGTLNTGTDQRLHWSGEDVVNLTAGSHTIDLDIWNSSNENTEASVYRACITIERWD